MDEKERFQFREVFNKSSVIKLANRIKKNYPQFDDKGFVNKINSKIDDLSFGNRNKLIQDVLIEYLPDDFEEVVRILITSLGTRNEYNSLEGYEGFIVMPQTYVIERLGMNNFDLSMKALYEMTMRFTSEGAIRRFIEKYPDKSLKLLMKWAKDKNAHVRRLVSEGTRPRLPLESPIRMFVKDPRPIIPLLDTLKDDPELFVRRSVANNLNDISKDNPKIVVDTLKRWKKGATKEREWVINHSLRTLFKQGNLDALKLMGFENPEIKIKKFTIKTKTVKLGEALEFEFDILSKKNQKLMIDYVIYFMKANGKHAPKTFKISRKKVKRDEEIKVIKKHHLKKMTTRKLYSGKHFVELQINGKSFGKLDFDFK